MLTEELAVAKATETFQKEGYKMDQWQLTRAGTPPSEAPDGTPDKYFDRFSFRPTEGRVSFTNGKRYRTVQVGLEGVSDHGPFRLKMRTRRTHFRPLLSLRHSPSKHLSNHGLSPVHRPSHVGISGPALTLSPLLPVE